MTANVGHGEVTVVVAGKNVAAVVIWGKQCCRTVIGESERWYTVGVSAAMVASSLMQSDSGNGETMEKGGILCTHTAQRLAVSGSGGTREGQGRTPSRCRPPS